MSVKQYSLLDFALSITFKKREYDIPVGGIGSYLGSIKVAKATDNISKTVDATGSGIFAYNHDHSGTIDIEISQVSTKVGEIINQVMEYYQSETEGKWKEALISIVIKKNGKKVIDAPDCMLTKMPDLDISPEAGMRVFSFAAIKIREFAITY